METDDFEWEFPGKQRATVIPGSARHNPFFDPAQ